MDEHQRVLEIISRLKRRYPGARTALRFETPWQLLVATILSAQSTDKMVNQVTERLFKKYKTVQDYANADEEEFQKDIRSTGFFRNKTKSVLGSARMILREFDGEVPRTMEEMLRLPGVARKTANIVLANSYDVVAGIPVDTHVKRVSARLGLTQHTDPDKIEQDLMRAVPREEWFPFSYLLIELGRDVCAARRPDHDTCVLADICPSAHKI
ncbi:MAG: endonuclease III [Actinobacteria bacterium]|nr:MAG: endonuclease III [Actinomycetota bacterium]